MQVANYRHGMLAPVLDVETGGRLGTTNLQAWVKTWLTRVYAKLHVHAVIYVTESFWSHYMGDTRWFADNGYPILWVAHWTSASAPTVPAQNWGGRSWTFWQYTSGGSVAGVSGSVDLDRFNGTSLTGVTW